MAGGTSHFYSFFFVNILARVDFLVLQLWPLALASPAQAKNASFTDIFSFGNAVTCLQLKCSNFVQHISSEVPIFVLTQGCIS